MFVRQQTATHLETNKRLLRLGFQLYVFTIFKIKTMCAHIFLLAFQKKNSRSSIVLAKKIVEDNDLKLPTRLITFDNRQFRNTRTDDTVSHTGTFIKYFIVFMQRVR